MVRLHHASVILVAFVAMLWMATGVGAATQGDPLANTNCEDVDVDGHGDDVSVLAWQTSEGDAGEYVVVAVTDDHGASGGNRAEVNERKTVQPRDLIAHASGHGDAVSECASDLFDREDDIITIGGTTDAHTIESRNHGFFVAQTATGHGQDARAALTFGDRDAHNVEINVTVKDTDGSGDATIAIESENRVNATFKPGEDTGSEELPGVTNVAAGSNLTVQVTVNSGQDERTTVAIGSLSEGYVTNLTIDSGDGNEPSVRVDYDEAVEAGLQVNDTATSHGDGVSDEAVRAAREGRNPETAEEVEAPGDKSDRTSAHVKVRTLDGTGAATIRVSPEADLEAEELVVIVDVGGSDE